MGWLDSIGSLLSNPSVGTTVKSGVGQTIPNITMTAPMNGGQAPAVQGVPGATPGANTGWYSQLGNWLKSPEGRAMIGMMGQVGGNITGGDFGGMVSTMGRNMAAGAAQEVENKKVGEMLKALLGGGSGLNF